MHPWSSTFKALRGPLGLALLALTLSLWLGSNAEAALPTATIDKLTPSSGYTTTTFYFEGSGTDADNDIVAYEWSSNRDGVLATRPVFNASLSVGTHTITWKVTDDDDNTDTDSRSVTVTANDLPVVDSLDLTDTQVYRNGSVALEASGSDDRDDQADLTAHFQYLPPINTQSITWSGSSRGRAFSVDISADGEYMVSGSKDGYISFWRKNSLTPLWRYEVDSGEPVRSVAISADGMYVAAGDENGTVYLFEQGQGEPLWVNRTLEEVWSVDLSADGRYLVAGSEDGNVTFYDRNYPEPEWRYGVAGSSSSVFREIWQVALSGDGRYVAVGTWDRVYLLRTSTGGKVWEDNVGNEVLSVAISYNGRYVVAGSQDKKVYFWDRSDVSNGGEFHTTGNVVFSVAMSGDGQYFAAGSKDQKAYFYNQAGSLWSSSVGSQVQSVALSNNTHFMLAGGSNGRTYLFDPTVSSSPIYNYDSGGWVQSTALTEDGYAFVDGGGSNKLNYHERWQDTDLGTVSWATDHFQTTFEPPLSAPTGDHLFRVALEDTEGGMSPWYYNNTPLTVRNNPPVADVDSFPPTPGYSTTASFNFAGHGTDMEAAVTAYQWVSDLQGTLSTAASFSLSSLQVGTHKVSFRVQDNEGVWSPWVNNTLVVRQNDPPESVDLKVSHPFVFHGQTLYLLANASDDWEAEANLQPEMTYKLPKGSFNKVNLTGNITAVGVSGDGSLFVAGDDAGKVSAYVDNSVEASWTYATGSAITAIDVAQNETVFMVGTATGTVYFFDADSSSPKWSNSQGGDILSLSLSEDGGAAGVGTNNSRVVYYETWSSTPQWYKTLGGKVNSVSITPGGDLLFCGSDDNYIRLYDLFGNQQWSFDTMADVNSVYAGSDNFVSGNENGDIYLHGSSDNATFWSNTTQGAITQVFISEDGNTVYTTDEAGELYLWDWRKETNGEDPLRWKYTGDDPLTHLALTNSGHYFLVGSDNGTVNYFENLSATPLWNFSANAAIQDLTLDYYGETRGLAAGTEGGIYFASWGTEYLGSEQHVGDHWEIAFRPTTSAPVGNFTFRIKFDDPQGAFGNWTYYPNVTAEVREGPPVAFIDSITEPAYDLFEVTFTGHGEDRRQTIVAYEWISDLDGQLSNLSSFSYTGLTAGTHQISFRVQDDGDEWSFNATYQLTVIAYQPPTVLDLSLTGNEVVRGGSLLLTANASDDEKAENALSVELESLFPGGQPGDWDSSYLGSPGYSGGQWRVSFAPATDAPLGRFGFRIRFGDGLGWSDWHYRNESLDIINNAPAATIDLVEPSPAELGQRVFLNGSGSDVDGTLEAYEWRSDRDGLLSDQAHYTTDQLTRGNHTLSFSVQDNDGAWSLEVTWELTVTELPVASIIDVGPALVNEGDTLTFNGSGQTSEGTIVGYQWSSDREGILSTQGNFSAADIPAGNHTITFRVRNSQGFWSPWVTWPTNLIINARPQAELDSITPNPAVEGLTVTFQGHGSDADGDIVAFRWRSNISGQLATTATFTSNTLALGNHTIYLAVQDDRGNWSTEVSWVLDIQRRSATNEKPTAQINSTSPDPVEQGHPVTFRGYGADSDGYIVAYEWRSDRDGIIGSTATLIRSDLSPGNHNIYLRVQDNQGEWSSQASSTLTVTPSTTNSKPFATILSIQPDPALLDETITFNGTGEDSDGYIIAYKWLAVNMDNLVIGTTANFTYAGLSAGTHIISFSVQDDLQAWSEPHEMTIKVRLPNRAPRAIVSSIPNSVSQGEDKTLDGSSSYDEDEGDQVVAYQWISDRDGLFSATATASTVSLSEGVHQITFRVRDRSQTWSTNFTFELEVGPAKTVPKSPSDDDAGAGSSLPIMYILAAAVVLALVGGVFYANQQGMFIGLGSKFSRGGGSGSKGSGTQYGPPLPGPGPGRYNMTPEQIAAATRASAQNLAAGMSSGSQAPATPPADVPLDKVFKPAPPDEAPPSQAPEEPMFKAVPEAPEEPMFKAVPDTPAAPADSLDLPELEAKAETPATPPEELSPEPKEQDRSATVAKAEPTRTGPGAARTGKAVGAPGTSSLTSGTGGKDQAKSTPARHPSSTARPRPRPKPTGGRPAPGKERPIPRGGAKTTTGRPARGPAEGVKRRSRPVPGDRPARTARGIGTQRPRTSSPAGRPRAGPPAARPAGSGRRPRPAKAGPGPGTRPKPRPRSAPPVPEMATIQCPACNARMEIPKLGRLQDVKCPACGIEGEVKV